MSSGVLTEIERLHELYVAGKFDKLKTDTTLRWMQTMRRKLIAKAAGARATATANLAMASDFSSEEFEAIEAMGLGHDTSVLGATATLSVVGANAMGVRSERWPDSEHNVGVSFPAGHAGREHDVGYALEQPSSGLDRQLLVDMREVQRAQAESQASMQAEMHSMLQEMQMQTASRISTPGPRTGPDGGMLEPVASVAARADTGVCTQRRYRVPRLRSVRRSGPLPSRGWWLRTRRSTPMRPSLPVRGC